MLRRVLVVLGLAGLAGGTVCALAGAWVPALYLFVEGGLLAVLVAFEQWRYVRPVNPAGGRWQRTGERFVDPGTGQLTDVYFNPETGERDYRPAAASDGGPGSTSRPSST